VPGLRSTHAFTGQKLLSLSVEPPVGSSPGGRATKVPLLISRAPCRVLAFLTSSKHYVPCTRKRKPLRDLPSPFYLWKNCRKLLKVKPKLVLGEDVTMSQVIELSSKSLIGRFYGRFILESKLLEWIERVWTHVLGSKSGYHRLVRGWMAFHFRTTDDARKIVGIIWFEGTATFSLEKWTPSFDTRSERLTIHPVWVKKLALELWSVEVFQAIGNSIGTFERLMSTLRWILRGRWLAF